MSLSAGAARAIITPPIGYRMGQWGLRQGRSTGIHRDLCARSLVLSDGATALALASVDVCGLPEELSLSIHSRIEELTSIPASNILLSSTHSHTTPAFGRSVPEELKDYSKVLVETVAGTVYSACSHTRPAAVGYGSGDLPGWSVNRQYPDRSIDTEVGVLVLDGVDGAPIARAVNFPCHGVCDGGQYLDWSGDFPGEMSAFMEETDSPAVCLFFQGAAGDIHPFDWWFGNIESKHMHTHEDTRRLGEALGSEALRVARNCDVTSEAVLKAATTRTKLPRRRVSWTIEDAQKLQVELEKWQVPYRGDVWPEGTTTANAAARHPEHYGQGANEILLAQTQNDPSVEITAQALRIGGLVISAVPGELFNELGRQIKDGRMGPTWCATYCRGSLGYVSTRKPYEDIAAVPLTEIVDMTRYRKYYGTTTSPFSPDAGEMLVATAIELFSQVED